MVVPVILSIMGGGTKTRKHSNRLLGMMQDAAFGQEAIHDWRAHHPVGGSGRRYVPMA